jgi:hypothetical protein
VSDLKASRFLPLLFLAMLLPASAFCAVDHFIIDIAASGQAGAMLGITITAKDASDIATAYTGTVTFTLHTSHPTAGTLTPNFTPGVSGNFGGSVQWIGGIQIFTAGTTTIDCVGAGGASATASVLINPNAFSGVLILAKDKDSGQVYMPGYPNSVTLTPGESPVIATVVKGSPVPVTIYAVDQFNNWNSSYTGAFNLINYAGTVTPSTFPAPTDGRGYFTLVFTSAGSQSVQTSTITTFSKQFNVIDPNDVFLHLISESSTVVAGVPFGVTASVSLSTSSPDPPVPTGSSLFQINRLQFGTGAPATGAWQPDYQFMMPAGKHFDRYTYQRAENIVLRLVEITQDSLNPTSVDTVIQVLPAQAAALQVSVSPAMIQATHEAVLTVTALDQYGNPTRSSLYPFVIGFEKLSSGGYLSVSRAAADINGNAFCTFTGGIVNETAHLRIRALHSISGAILAEVLQDVKVSIAAAEAGSIHNLPNPFHPARNETTAINYFLTSDSDIELRIYDAFGRLVLSRDISRGSNDPATSAGGASFTWDGRNGEQKLVANGIYQVRIRAHGSDGTQQDFKRRVGVVK